MIRGSFFWATTCWWPRWQSLTYTCVVHAVIIFVQIVSICPKNEENISISSKSPFHEHMCTFEEPPMVHLSHQALLQQNVIFPWIFCEMFHKYDHSERTDISWGQNFIPLNNTGGSTKHIRNWNCKVMRWWTFLKYNCSTNIFSSLYKPNLGNITGCSNSASSGGTNCTFSLQACKINSYLFFLKYGTRTLNLFYVYGTSWKILFFSFSQWAELRFSIIISHFDVFASPSPHSLGINAFPELNCLAAKGRTSSRRKPAIHLSGRSIFLMVGCNRTGCLSSRPKGAYTPDLWRSSDSQEFNHTYEMLSGFNLLDNLLISSESGLPYLVLQSKIWDHYAPPYNRTGLHIFFQGNCNFNASLPANSCSWYTTGFTTSYLEQSTTEQQALNEIKRWHSLHHLNAMTQRFRDMVLKLLMLRPSTGDDLIVR